MLTSPPDVSPRFFLEAVEDHQASERAGRRIFRDEERVELSFLRNPYMRPIVPVTDEHRQQWPEEYSTFRRGQEIATHGTPIDILPFLKPAQVHELKLLGFEIVEDLRDMSGQAAQQIPQGHRLKQLAEAYLDDAASLAALTAAQAENDRQAGEIAALQREIDNLREQNAQLHERLRDQSEAPEPVLTGVRQEPEQSALAGLPELPLRRRKVAAAADVE
jgi:hypothetical protein